MRSKKSKRQRAQELFDLHKHLLACPRCQLSFDQADSRLLCKNGHSFDMAKKGYLNLLAGHPKETYTREMFLARRHIIFEGYFDPLLTEIKYVIANSKITSIEKNISCAQEGPIFKPHGYILDAGCGEGTLLEKILEDQLMSNFMPAGIDIAKEAIYLAARDYPGRLWMVGDVANPPLAPGQFSILLNILTPANYKAFKRILECGGMLVKVFPGDFHLRELKTFLVQKSTGSEKNQGGAKAENNSKAEGVEKIFADRFKQFMKKRITYQYQCSGLALKKLLKMSPITWSIQPPGEESRLDLVIQEVEALDKKTITFDFQLLCGRK